MKVIFGSREKSIALCNPKTNYIFGKEIKKRPRKILIMKSFRAILVEIIAFKDDAMKSISAVFKVRPFQVIG